MKQCNDTYPYINPQNKKKYRFFRICRLPGCNNEIYTNRKEHFFCCENHQQEYWKRIRAGDRIVQNEVSKLRKEIEELKQKISN